MHSSLRGIASALLTPAALLVIGGLTIASRGVHAVPVVLVVAGAGFALVVLFDYPTRTEVGPEGLTRHCLARRHLIGWDDVERVERAAGPRLRRYRGEGLPGERRRSLPAPGGLVARRGRRRYLLVDQAESDGEWDALVAAAETWAPDVAVTAARPPASVPPTWLYRRRTPGKRA